MVSIIAFINILLIVFIISFIAVKIARRNISIKTTVILLLILVFLVKLHFNGNRYVTIDGVQKNIDWILESVEREKGSPIDTVEDILSNPQFRSTIESPIVKTKFGYRIEKNEAYFYSYGYDNDNDNCKKLYKNKIYMILFPYYDGDILLKKWRLSNIPYTKSEI